jgi:hypothetical protein
VSTATEWLAPFFSYYGSKHRIIRRYPRPTHGRIVEPFAGSAAYATAYHWLPVALYDANPKVVGVWDYLIRAKPAEILALPVDVDGDIAVLPIPQEPQWLIGWWSARARAHPARNASAWMREYGQGQFWGEGVRARIASAVGHIRHWRVGLSDWSNVPVDAESTCFVDPPYQGCAGLQYRAYGSRHIDYNALGEWCRCMPGQAIVCEGQDARWLPFEPLCENNGLKGVKTEMLWTNREAEPVYCGLGL